MLFSRALIASSIAYMAHAQTTATSVSYIISYVNTITTSSSSSSYSGTYTGTTTTNAQQSSSIAADIGSYYSSVIGQTSFHSNIAVVASAVPAPEGDINISAQDPAYFTSVLGASPMWFSSVPAPVQNYIKSIATKESSIVSKDLKGPAPTHGPAAKAAAAVGAAAGFVAMAL